MFSDLESATRFCQFYRRYDFLKPRGIVANGSDKWEGIVDELDEQVGSYDGPVSFQWPCLLGQSCSRS